jgi:ferredoxin
MRAQGTTSDVQVFTMSDTVGQFIEFLRRHDDEAWAAIVASLLPDVHPVDQNALRVWFAFYPVKLFRMLAEDEARARQDCLLNGRYRLADHIHTSHRFFYGHRFWPKVQKAVLIDLRTPPRTTLENHICQAARRTGVDPTLALGITAVAYATLQQVGVEAFSTPPPPINVPQLTPAQIIAERRRPEPRTLRDLLLRSEINQTYTICFDEHDPAAKFQAIYGQPLTTAAGQMPNAAAFKKKDPRCVAGPIPTECQTGACGTCWIGVLSGAENLSAITPFEVTRLKKIGYPYDGTEHPVIRLACKTVCEGKASIVIPPWNGVLANWDHPPIRG